MENIKKYFHDSSYFMTLKSHKDYMNKYSNKILIIKNSKDIQKFIRGLK